MPKVKTAICKTKGCNNPVLNGKYCEFCKQKRKENGQKVAAAGVAVGIPAAGYAIKKGALKQIPKFAKSVLQAVLKK